MDKINSKFVWIFALRISKFPKRQLYVIDRALHCNADRSIGTSLPFDCFIITTAIWRNYHQLITLSQSALKITFLSSLSWEPQLSLDCPGERRVSMRINCRVRGDDETKTLYNVGGKNVPFRWYIKQSQHLSSCICWYRGKIISEW